MKRKDYEQKQLDPYCDWDIIVHEAVVDKAKREGYRDALNEWRKKHENEQDTRQEKLGVI